MVTPVIAGCRTRSSRRGEVDEISHCYCCVTRTVKASKHYKYHRTRNITFFETSFTDLVQSSLHTHDLLMSSSPLKYVAGFPRGNWTGQRCRGKVASMKGVVYRKRSAAPRAPPSTLQWPRHPALNKLPFFEAPH